MKKVYFLILCFLVLSGCKKDDETLIDVDPQQNEVVTVANRIEFSGMNDIPNSLKVLSFDGTINVGTSNIPEPQFGNGIEFLVNGNDDLVFVKRNLPGQNNSKINSTSTVLYFATINTLFSTSSPSEQQVYINQIIDSSLFNQAVNFLNSQSTINLFASQFINFINELISDVFFVESIEPNTLQLGSVDYLPSSNLITINNPTNNHIAFGVYKNGIQQGIELIDKENSAVFEMEETDIDFLFNLMSGEEAATNIYGNNELEEIEAFNADMRDFLKASAHALIGFAFQEACFDQIFELIYEDVMFALEFGESESTLQAVINALEIFFVNFSGTLEIADLCSESIDIGSLSQIFELIGQIFDALDAGEFLADIAVSIQDYSIYENQYQICLKTDATGVFICEQNNVEPAENPSPENNAINIPVNGDLSFTPGANTPSNATFKILFDNNSNPTTAYNLPEETTSLSYSNLLENTNYYWIVETLDNNGDILATSPIWTFTTTSSSGGDIFNGDVNLTTQNEVIDFGSNNYSGINGNLLIEGISTSEITDLTPLSSITAIDGNVEIQSNLDLMTLNGLNSIEIITGSLVVQNTGMNNLAGLANLSSVFNFSILQNPNLVNFIGFELITSTQWFTQISHNPNLTSLTGLNNLQSTGATFYIDNNISLVSIEALNSFTTVESNYGLTIAQNDILENLDGLSQLSTVGGLAIHSNNQLINFCDITNLIVNGNYTAYSVQNNEYNPTEQDIINGDCSQ